MFGTTPAKKAKKFIKQLDDLQKAQRYSVDFSTLPEMDELAKAVISAGPETQIELIRQTVQRVGALGKLFANGTLSWWDDFPRAASEMTGRLLRKKLPYSDDDMVFMVTNLAAPGVVSIFSVPYLGPLVLAVGKYLKSAPLSPELQGALKHLADATGKCGRAEEVRLRAKVEALALEAPKLPIQKGEAWSDVALADLESMKEDKQDAWARLIGHCLDAQAGKPTAKWTKAAKELLKEIRFAEFKKHILAWFPLVDKPRTIPLQRRSDYVPDPNLLIIDPHANILKGLAWCCGLREDKELARALMALAISAYRKVPQIGPRAVRVGNACVWALGAMPGMDAVGQLALLKVKVKFGTAQKGIEKSLTAAAERAGIPKDELEEMAVPAYGLTEVGEGVEELGDYRARLVVTGTTTVDLIWEKADGKTVKSVPATVKKDFAADLKEIRDRVKDIKRMLPAQRDRIDNLFLEQRVWPFSVWRERYLDHPLVGTLARRLIWVFGEGKTEASGIWHDGNLVSTNDKPIGGFADDTPVRLWHPIGRRLNEVTAWRAWLEERAVRQPFKQAHREVYIATDAELETGVYSNRFAAHIIRQHQFNALCAVRGWKNKLRLMVDDACAPPTRYLPNWNLRAEFWVESVGDEYGVDTNDSGTFLYLATDQVRFYPIDAPHRWAHVAGGGYAPAYGEQDAEPMKIEEVPLLVFSEIMRDVDLFVGVGSVGNDPNWSDGGPRGAYREYWHDYAFGDLSATATTRKEVLERLVPKLKIAAKCSFADNFLLVEGTRHTYKIHLGSGNILMLPNDQYLCIVPGGGGRRATDKLFLPFEGDQKMSEILSKALMLAEDNKITDRTILNQIK